MNLIPISSNVLVNPECISCIEQKVSLGADITFVWVGEKSYILEVPLQDFYKSLGVNELGEVKQYFAG